MSSKLNKPKGPVIGAAAAGVTALALAGFFGWKAVTPSAPQLPVDTYLANARSLSGNQYAVKARIERQLDTREGAGRIILARETLDGRPVPFLDGGKAPAFNPEPGQLYMLTVRVALDGLLELTSAKKM